MLIFFYRGTDDYSVTLRRRLRAVAKRYEEAAAYVIDIDTHPAATGEFAVYQVPAVRVWVDGTIVLQKAGDFEAAELDRLLARYTRKMGGARP